MVPGWGQCFCSIVKISYRDLTVPQVLRHGHVHQRIASFRAPTTETKLSCRGGTSFTISGETAPPSLNTLNTTRQHLMTAFPKKNAPPAKQVPASSAQVLGGATLSWLRGEPSKRGPHFGSPRGRGQYMGHRRAHLCSRPVADKSPTFYWSSGPCSSGVFFAPRENVIERRRCLSASTFTVAHAGGKAARRRAAMRGVSAPYRSPLLAGKPNCVPILLLAITLRDLINQWDLLDRAPVSPELYFPGDRTRHGQPSGGCRLRRSAMLQSQPSGFRYRERCQEEAVLTSL